LATEPPFAKQGGLGWPVFRAVESADKIGQMPGRFCVYIMANEARTLYVGVTSQLTARVVQHKLGAGSGFTARYGLSKLVYREELPDAAAAIAREKQIKGWNRARKIALVESMNPTWEDLAGEL
jgi:putative endonuclease